jgi:hypothetical protein
VTLVERIRRGTATAAARVLGPPAAGLGRVLAVPLGGIARLRHGKPMHPRGVVLDAVLERTGTTPPWGVPWLDRPGRDRAVVRLSRGAGLPDRLPDLLGLAVHLPGEDVDLLLSSTGRGRLSRLVPAARRDPATTYGSIMGYRSAAGTLRLAAIGERTAGGSADGGNGLVFALAAARGSGTFRPFGRLVLGAQVPAGDPDVRFDAVRRPPPGLRPDGPMARLRAPSYARARAGRDPDGAGRL